MINIYFESTVGGKADYFVSTYCIAFIIIVLHITFTRGG